MCVCLGNTRECLKSQYDNYCSWDICVFHLLSACQSSAIDLPRREAVYRPCKRRQVISCRSIMTYSGPRPKRNCRRGLSGYTYSNDEKNTNNNPTIPWEIKIFKTHQKLVCADGGTSVPIDLPVPVRFSIVFTYVNDLCTIKTKKCFSLRAFRSPPVFFSICARYMHYAPLLLHLYMYIYIYANWSHRRNTNFSVISDVVSPRIYITRLITVFFKNGLRFDDVGRYSVRMLLGYYF